MSKIGNVKATLDQADENKLALNVDEVDELTGILDDAKAIANEHSEGKYTGVVTLEVRGGKIYVGASKVKSEDESNES